MWKRFFKKLGKNEYSQKIISYILLIYLKFVFLTSSRKFSDKINPLSYTEGGVILAFWHQDIALAIEFFRKYYGRTTAVVSPHSDGLILSNVIKNFGCDIISGSSNKNSFHAARKIIEELYRQRMLLITPDGPKGPAKKINSNIMPLANIAGTSVIVVSFRCSRYFRLNSWDKMIIPLPFTKIEIMFGEKIHPTGKKLLDNEKLEKAFAKLSHFSL